MMIVSGGHNGKQTGPLSTTEIFNGDSGQWFKLTCNNLPQPLCGAQSVIVGDFLYVLGGLGQGNVNSAAVYASPVHDLSTSHKLQWQCLLRTLHQAVQLLLA